MDFTFNQKDHAKNYTLMDFLYQNNDKHLTTLKHLIYNLIFYKFYLPFRSSNAIKNSKIILGIEIFTKLNLKEIYQKSFHII